MSTKLLTIKEAARVMHISPQTIYAWIAKGKIGAVNLNEDNRRALWRIPLSEVEDKIGLPVCPETLEPIIFSTTKYTKKEGNNENTCLDESTT